MSHTDIRNEMVALGTSLFERGFSVGSAGNISVRVDDGYLMTPTNSSLGRLAADRISLLDENWKPIDGDPPSKEVVMHRAMYEARPDARAVVHLHSTYVTALSCLVQPDQPLIRPHTPYLVMRLGTNIPKVPYYRPGDPGMEQDILVAARDAHAIILSNHGSLVAAGSLVDAINAAEELEASAQLAVLLEGRETRPLTGAEIADLVRR